MKILTLKAKNFMIFEDIELDFSPNVNLICGENSTGKTAIIKLLYASLRGVSQSQSGKKTITKDNIEAGIVQKIQGVYCPDKNSVGRLVNRIQGSNRAQIDIELDNNKAIGFGFSNRHSSHVEMTNAIDDMEKMEIVYIPPKEIISATENFGSLYADYHIAFEEMYYDLARLLEKPLRKGPNTKEQNTVLKSFEEIVNGSIIQKDRKFYLKEKGSGEFEMGLVSEGYRKIATIIYLILSGSLSKNSILFWDEPETNMNPKMIRPMVEALTELARMGVQVFVTTHDYFVQQCFNLNAVYNKDGNKRIRYNFVSLYKNNDGVVQAETGSDLSDLTHNSIMEEFDNLYDREQGLIYGD